MWASFIALLLLLLCQSKEEEIAILFRIHIESTYRKGNTLSGVLLSEEGNETDCVKSQGS